MGRTSRGANGVIHQAGLGVKRHDAPQRAVPGLLRAVVMATYPTDSEDNQQSYQVTCDLLLLRSNASLFNVPVALAVGVNNASLPWIPKPTTGTLSGAPLVFRVMDSRGNNEPLDPTAPSDFNGDVVLVQFIESDEHFPVIVGRLTHLSTFRKVIDGPGWAENTSRDAQRGVPESREVYHRHAGTEVRINETGDILIDTVGATTDELTEVPDPFFGGAVRVRLKPGQRLVVAGGGLVGAPIRADSDLISLVQNADNSISVRLADGNANVEIDALGNARADLLGKVVVVAPIVGPATVGMLGATQPFVKGLALQSALSALTLALGGYAAALGPPTGVPPPVVTGAAAQAATIALNTALLLFSTQVAAALSLTIKGE